MVGARVPGGRLSEAGPSRKTTAPAQRIGRPRTRHTFLEDGPGSVALNLSVGAGICEKDQPPK